MMYQQQDPDYKQLFIAIFLAALVLVGWQALVEWPRRQQLATYHQQEMQKRAKEQAAHVERMQTRQPESEDDASLSRTERIALSPRLRFESPKLHGSIALKGARFDDVTLAKYRETLDPASPEVTLFAPNGDAAAYFAQIGWISADGKTRVPDQNSVWETDAQALVPGQSAHLRWDNGAGVVYHFSISLDNDYMFQIGQRVENNSGAPISVAPYAYVNRAYAESTQHYAILHEGPLGVMQDTLEEVPYSTLRDKRTIMYEQADGWLGITDKYWLSALIPDEKNYKVTFSHYRKGTQERYQVDYVGQVQQITPATEGEVSRVRLFAGAKEVNVLDRYAAGDAARNEPPVPLFDRAVDFGMLYFMTKPMFEMLNFFFVLTGNFGIAILLLTIVIRIILYPLANKSYKATDQMRRLQPEMVKIRERYFDDQIALNKELMALYKREKVNPAAGCLPLLIQMPVFFALYKVLFVTIEMRHAPFFGWIKDLSAPDPSNLFNAFGLLPWAPPNWLHLGLLPILYCLSMVIQMKQQPKPTDPVQAKVMAYMPYFLLIIFATMPAGLVLYWLWSNIISIIQQYIITRRHDKQKQITAKAA